MDDRDTKGDVYEYMLGKIASAGQNGQFRTPRHIIALMVELTEPKPTDTIRAVYRCSSPFQSGDAGSVTTSFPAICKTSSPS